jgi:CelD/BcsL family acetyltransferase involved in cellulose biosynthesis
VIGGTDSGAEYQVWIARQQIEREVFREIVNALRIMRSEWDLIWMPSLEGWSGLTDNLIDALREGGFWVNCRSCKFSSVALPNDFESYLNSMSSNRRQQIRRMRRRILENSDVQIRKVESTTELADALATLFDLHGRRWHAVGKEGVFASRPIEKKFYETFTPRALSNGWLAIYVLSDLGQPKAIQFGYVYNNLFLQLQEGFDPEYAAHVGNVLRAHVIENCINDGIEEYDFLGGVSEHKRRWMAEERSGMDLLVARSCLKNFPIMRFGVWPTGAYLRPDECDLVH